MSIGKETGQSTDGAWRGRGPSAQTRIVEITSGKTNLPAGADSNLQRPVERGKPKSAGGIWVWRMSPSERGRRSNVLPNGPRGHYRRGNASTVQKGSRHLVGMGATPVGTLSSIQPVRVGICVEPSSKLERSGAYASQRLSFDLSGKARWGNAKVANRTREIRLSGMKTGARGNVTHGGTVNPSRNRKGVAGNPSPKSARAPALSKPHYWGRTLKGNWAIRRKTEQSRFSRARHRIASWCRANRHLPIKEQHAMLTLKLRGHDAYYGITGNARALSKLRNWVERDWFKWLRRRSYAAWRNWEWMQRLLTVFPLPAPRVVHSVLPRAAKP
jgi:Group II intron, maturase-specific domain